MAEEPITTPEEKLEKIAQQNKQMRKKLLIAVAVTAGIVAVLVTVLLIVKACTEDDEPFSLPDSYFYPTHVGDIFEYADYLDKNPEVMLYCNDPNGMGRTTSIEDEKADELPTEVFYLRDFLKIMMHADIDAYNNCFNEIYYKNHKKNEGFSQQMIYGAEIRFVSEEKKSNGERSVTYYLHYKLYENDGSLRRDVGSDAIVPMKIVLRVTTSGEISISEWATTRTK